MLAELQGEEGRFSEMMEKLFRGISSEDSLNRLKAKAWDHFLELGLPTKRSEVFQYVKLKKLFAKDFAFSAPSAMSKMDVQRFVLPESQHSHLTFLNGCFRPDLSDVKGLPSKTLAMPLAEAMRSFSSLLTNQMVKRLQEESDPFAALNGALSQRACFIYLPPQTVLETPLQILHIIDCSEAPIMMSPRIELFFGAQAEAKIISTAVPVSGDNYFVNGSLNFSCEEGSRANLVQKVLGVPSKSWYFEAVRGNLKKDSSFSSVSLTDGCEGARFDYRINLQGENGECFLNGLWLLNKISEAHTHVLMNHQAPNCQSMQFFKGALKDFSHSSFEGKIYVHREAQKTQAFQLNNNLLLSERVQADCKPNLEIFADDVKASHGATFGQLDENESFYLRTRGISEAQAKKLLVAGFCKEIIEKIPHPSIQADALRHFQGVLDG